MNGTCRFVDVARYFDDDVQKRKVQALELTLEDGFRGIIFVTDKDDFSFIQRDGREMNVWRYELSADGKRISLHNRVHGSSSVGWPDPHHIIVEDWPLVK